MFSELKNICEDTGLGFSDEHSALYGKKNGFGVTVTDTDDIYEVKVFCVRPFDLEEQISALVSDVGESLPKNTVKSLSLEASFVCLRLEKSCLLQENIVYLIGALDKLTSGLGELEAEGSEPYLPVVKRTGRELPAKKEMKIKLGFDMRSVIGLFGALIGAAAMTVIAVLIVNVRFEINTFGLAFEVSTYVLSAATVAVIFADYRFLAKKLDACGVIACPVLSVISVILAGLGAGVKVYSQALDIPFMAALRTYSDYLSKEQDIDRFVAGYITRGLVLAVIASIVVCIWYFRRHPDEMILTEKAVTEGDGKQSKR